MNLADPNLPLLESVARALGPFCNRFVFVGGCATGLLITDPAASPVRATRDVDVVVEVATLGDYHALERQLEEAGFKHDRSPEAPVCRWVVAGCLLDVMPTDETVLGFGNRWYDVAARTAQPIQLRGESTIRGIAPPVFVAKKLEAFRGRGRGGFLASLEMALLSTSRRYICKLPAINFQLAALLFTISRQPIAEFHTVSCIRDSSSASCGRHCRTRAWY